MIARTPSAKVDGTKNQNYRLVLPFAVVEGIVTDVWIIQPDDCTNAFSKGGWHQKSKFLWTPTNLAGSRCMAPACGQQLRELNREGQRLVQENQGLQSRLAYLQSRAEQQAAKVDEESNEVTKASRQQMVKDLLKDLLKETDDVRRTMKANSVQCQELAQRSERIEQQMREW
jgi:hypothetical protein